MNLNIWVHQSEQQELGTSQYKYQICGLSKNNANIGYMTITAIIWYVNNKYKYKIHQGLYIILVHHNNDNILVQQTQIRI